MSLPHIPHSTYCLLLYRPNLLYDYYLHCHPFSLTHPLLQYWLPGQSAALSVDVGGKACTSPSRIIVGGTLDGVQVRGSLTRIRYRKMTIQ